VFHRDLLELRESLSFEHSRLLPLRSDSESAHETKDKRDENSLLTTCSLKGARIPGCFLTRSSNHSLGSCRRAAKLDGERARDLVEARVYMRYRSKCALSAYRQVGSQVGDRKVIPKGQMKAESRVEGYRVDEGG